MKRGTKTLIIVGAVISMFFGLFMCSYTTMYRAISDTKIIYKQESLQSVDRIAVDSKGNIYYGLFEVSLIQVYDSSGKYKYGFSFHKSASGSNDFYLDDLDNVHIIAAHNGKYIFSKNGEIHNAPMTTRDKINMSGYLISIPKYEIESKSGLLYKLNRINHQIKVYDIETNELVKVIAPEAPKWPWKREVYFIIMATGIVINLFFVFYKEVKERVTGFVEVFRRDGIEGSGE